jgi:hypothetical protein
MIVNIIANQNINSSKRATRGECMPKNIIDHKILRTSCVAKIKTTFAFSHVPVKNFWDNEFHAFLFSEPILFFGLQFLDQTKYKEIPIKKNSVGHTTAKIQSGGLNKGLFKVLYQPLTCGNVKNEPITPANSQIIRLANNFNILLYFIIIIAGRDDK